MSMHQSSRLFLERRLSLLYGAESVPMRALDLVMQEMCAGRGYHRYDGSDYYMHCVDVANFLISYGISDGDAVAAALLHDIVEDVPGFTKEGLANMFNPAVAAYVDAVTTKPGLDYHDPEVLQAYLDNIAGNIYTAAIKTADRMHNMFTLADASMEKRYRKALETEEFYIPFFKECRNLYPRYEGLFQAAKTQILPQIYEIKAHYADYRRMTELEEQLAAKGVIPVEEVTHPRWDDPDTGGTWSYMELFGEASLFAHSSPEVGLLRIGDEMCLRIPGEVNDLPVVFIDPGSFRNEDGFERLILPDSIRCISENAFAGCSRLRHMNVPEDIMEVQKGAFEGTLLDRELLESFAELPGLCFTLPEDDTEFPEIDTEKEEDIPW